MEFHYLKICNQRTLNQNFGIHPIILFSICVYNKSVLAGNLRVLDIIPRLVSPAVGLEMAVRVPYFYSNLSHGEQINVVQLPKVLATTLFRE